MISDIALRLIPSWLLNIIRYLKVKLGYEPETPYTLDQIKSTIELQGMYIIKAHVYWKFIVMGIAVLVAVKEHDTLDLSQ